MSVCHHDQYDRRIRATAPGANSGPEVTRLTLDPNGNVTQLRTPRDTVQQRAYDRLDRMTSTTNPEGDVASTTYDAAGKTLTQRRPRGNVTGLSDAERDKFTTSQTYNAAGDMTSERNGLGFTTWSAPAFSDT